MEDKNYGCIKFDANSKKGNRQHIAKVNNGLAGAKINEILDRGVYVNHDADRQHDNIYLYIDEAICGEFDYEKKKVVDMSFNSDTSLKDYIKSTDYYSVKDKYGRTHKLADDNIVCREFFFWFSPDQIERMKPNIEEWGRANLEFIQQRFPTFKIVCAVVHMHETSPHMQLLAIPFDEKGKLNNFKYFYDDNIDPAKKSKKRATGRITAQQLETDYAEAVGLRFGLQRGVMGTEEAVSYEESKVKTAKQMAKQAVEQAEVEQLVAHKKIEKIEQDTQAILTSIQKPLSVMQDVFGDADEINARIEQTEQELQVKQMNLEMKKIQLDEIQEETRNAEMNLLAQIEASDNLESTLKEKGAFSKTPTKEEYNDLLGLFGNSYNAYRGVCLEKEHMKEKYNQLTNKYNKLADDYEALDYKHEVEKQELSKHYEGVIEGLKASFTKFVSRMFNILARLGIHRPIGKDEKEQLDALELQVINSEKYYIVGRDVYKQGKERNMNEPIYQQDMR